jgi:hypothetical protein
MVSREIGGPFGCGAPPVTALRAPSVPPTTQPQTASNNIIPAIANADDRLFAV